MFIRESLQRGGCASSLRHHSKDLASDIDLYALCIVFVQSDSPEKDFVAGTSREFWIFLSRQKVFLEGGHLLQAF